jgi:hypothetical protein
MGNNTRGGYSTIFFWRRKLLATVKLHFIAFDWNCFLLVILGGEFIGFWNRLFHGPFKILIFLSFWNFSWKPLLKIPSYKISNSISHQTNINYLNEQVLSIHPKCIQKSNKRNTKYKKNSLLWLRNDVFFTFNIYIFTRFNIVNE